MRPLTYTAARVYHVSRRVPRVTTPLTAAQQSLVTDNIRLPYRVLSKHFHAYRRHPELYSELEAAALCGLCYAAQRFLASNGAAFSTFAYRTIWGFVKNAMRDRHRTQTNEIAHYFDEPRIGSTCRATDYRELAPLARAADSERRSRIVNAFRFLDAHDANILRALYGLDGHPETQALALARTLGISRERLRQRTRRALRRVRDVYLHGRLTPRLTNKEV